MTIRANIEERMVQMQQEIEQFGPQGGEISRYVKEAAINAIMGGPQEWEVYMEIFAKNPDELARLIPHREQALDPDKREALAYLVSNAVCAPGTATGLIENVFDRLDPQSTGNS